MYRIRIATWPASFPWCHPLNMQVRNLPSKTGKQSDFAAAPGSGGGGIGGGGGGGETTCGAEEGEDIGPPLTELQQFFRLDPAALEDMQMTVQVGMVSLL